MTKLFIVADIDYEGSSTVTTVIYSYEFTQPSQLHTLHVGKLNVEMVPKIAIHRCTKIIFSMFISDDTLQNRLFEHRICSTKPSMMSKNTIESGDRGARKRKHDDVLPSDDDSYLTNTLLLMDNPVSISLSLMQYADSYFIHTIHLYVKSIQLKYDYSFKFIQ